MMNNLVVIPYTQINGEWTLRDDIVKGFYRLMASQGTARVVFYSGTVKNEDEFLAACRISHTVFILENTGRPVAIGWLNNFMGSSANAHWVTFKGSWGTEKTHEAIQATLRYWFHFMKDGKPLFNVLLGIYPEENKRIDKFAKEAGFTVIGTIPGLIYNFWENRTVGAVFSYIERRSICHS